MGNGRETRPKHLPGERSTANLVMSVHPTTVSAHLCRPSLTADEVVQMCAKEIGMNPQSSTPVSMQDIRAMDTCVNKYGFKTKP